MLNIKEQYDHRGEQKAPSAHAAYHFAGGDLSLIKHSDRPGRNLIPYPCHIHIKVQKQGTDKHCTAGYNKNSGKFSGVLESHYHTITILSHKLFSVCHFCTDP